MIAPQPPGYLLRQLTGISQDARPMGGGKAFEGEPIPSGHDFAIQRWRL